MLIPAATSCQGRHIVYLTGRGPLCLPSSASRDDSARSVLAVTRLRSSTQREGPADSPHPVPAGPPPTVTELRARTVFRVPPTAGSASPTVSAMPSGGSAPAVSLRSTGDSTSSSGGAFQHPPSSTRPPDRGVIWRRTAGARASSRRGSSPERVSLRRGLAALPSAAGDSEISATSSGGAFESPPSSTRPPEREVIWKRAADTKISCLRKKN